MAPIPSSTTGADALCDTLLNNGIDVCFANPGTSEMHFVAALDRKPQMRCILGLFEGVVTGAADGYARMADRPAVTLLHLGPGLANGLANLHNARRAQTPVVNVVGEHATYHVKFDAPLTSDIEALAAPMSHWVRTIAASDAVSSDAADAIAAACSAPGHIATLILPADVSWGDTKGGRVAKAKIPPPASPSGDAVRAAAAALRNGKKTVILATGSALRARPLETASRIAQASGARLLAQQANGRMERGAGRVIVDRVPFNVDAAIDDLAGTEQIVLVGSRVPVAFFAYPGKPSTLLPPACRIVELASPDTDLVQALDWLADELAIPASTRPLLDATPPPDLPTGALTARSTIVTLGRMLPDHAIVCDESVSSGRDLFAWTRGAPPHDFLPITGGAIGLGLPLSIGAAVACPGRKVVCLQADGSGMYTLQALWTQARERLDIVTVILSNRSYAILHGELRKVGAGTAGRNARRMLDLDDPALGWVKLANGLGVEAAAVDTVEAFVDVLGMAMKRPGPFLIEAVLAPG
ncbi:Putative acetolactate synthase large subunit IlvX [Pigmentiphaga humi]|uniref:Acetolactate synthase large subunit IlvX n=1 Tax=Pigmentiphaga humi TaxID=2478468 RepID=A0A3P4AVZ4_9BURK|nr:acetolactate synthase large subunit [Pigmentiphaga humi]VCU68187.1 Putative acetolactate synthase large subunit IlvX [Pigmentiphaga humi]